MDKTTTFESFQAMAAAVAAGLGEHVTAQLLFAWQKRGCPLPPGRGAKTMEHVQDVINWRQEHHNPPGRPKASDDRWANGTHAPGASVISSEPEEVQNLEIAKLKEEIRKLQNHNQAAEGKRIDAAEVTAQALREAASLRDWLQAALPAEAYDLSTGSERLIAIERIRSLIIAKTNEWAQAMELT